MRKAIAGWLCLGAAWAADPVDIGTRRELFLDRFLIESMRGTELRLQQPVEREVALRFDRKWEGAFCNYATVIRDGGAYRLYYRGTAPGGQDREAATVTCLAESADGVHWKRPSLGLVEAAGSRQNNVILSDPDYSSDFSPMLDTRPGAPASERYKALAGTIHTGLAAFASPDGVRWRKLREEPVLPRTKTSMFDSQNLAFWSESEGKYVCYFRTFKAVEGMGRVRWISRTTSDDFLNWAPPVEMTFGDAPPEHLYINQTAPYYRAPHLYVATSARFMPKRRVLTAEQALAIGVKQGYAGDTSDVVLLSSRGGGEYQRTFLESFLRPGPGYSNWASRTNYPALNVLETGPAEMSLWVVRDYAQPTAHLRRYSLRIDGFASVHAGYGGGEMTTRTLKFTGRRLEINYATSAAGGLRVELQDAAGKAIPGFALEDSGEIVGDEIARTATWKGSSDVSSLAGRPVRLRFALKDADLYSIRFAN